ncbi:DUF6053 domain-containing protein [Lysobacter enzymogenes]|uniref:DUF6053 domain-containing protein n=1 Tax=Lysobacter enzymogenes TaxID=69 RepID=UPI00339AA244
MRGPWSAADWPRPSNLRLTRWIDPASIRGSDCNRRSSRRHARRCSCGTPCLCGGASAPTLFGQIAVACNDRAGAQAPPAPAALSATP